MSDTERTCTSCGAPEARDGLHEAGDCLLNLRSRNAKMERENSRLERGLVGYRGLIDGFARAHAMAMELVAAERNKACHERDAALCRASEATQECGRLEAQQEHNQVLLNECREWLMAGNPDGTKLGYSEFRERLDKAIDGWPTYPFDRRPKGAREP